MGKAKRSENCIHPMANNSHMQAPMPRVAGTDRYDGTRYMDLAHLAAMPWPWGPMVDAQLRADAATRRRDRAREAGDTTGVAVADLERMQAMADYHEIRQDLGRMTTIGLEVTGILDRIESLEMRLKGGSR